MEILNKALLIYYFNIVMIATIILMVLIVGYNRTKKVVINIGEKSSPIGKESKQFYKNMFIVVYFGLLFFTLREFSGDLMKTLGNAFEWLAEVING